MKNFGVIASITTCAALLSTGLRVEVPLTQVSEYPSPRVREQQMVVVDGVQEVWRLEWTTEPKPVCEPSEVSLTCPCMGFAYGEGGGLAVVTLRDGIEIDRLDITAYFEEQFSDVGRLAIVKLREPDYDKDYEASSRDGFLEEVTKRKIAQVMFFGDYNHDGWSSEFYLQTESAPCGKSVGVVIGVSKENRHLHAFGTKAHPGKPLYLHKKEWEAVPESNGWVDVLDWPCGDHGAETETRLRLLSTPEGLEGVRRVLTCPEHGEKQRLISEEPL